MEHKSKFTIGGTEFFLTKEDIERELRGVQPESVREVYVEVNGKRYPVKQALAQAAGLIRGGFTTHDAIRVFRKLSLPVGTGSEIDLTTMPERCYAMLKSLNEFDRQHIRGVIRGLLAKTERDNCFIGNYYRATANIETLLTIKSAKDLQTIAMVARSLFELAVDVKLINSIPDAVRKIAVFSDVEKLRAARKIVAFKAANPTTSIDATIHEEFIGKNTARIEAERKAVWPDSKSVMHWSGLNLAQRAALLKAPFDEIYQVEYPRLSWYVHSGLTGFVNLDASTFNTLAANQNKLAGECYVELLTALIDEFGIEKADPNVKNRLKLARLMPFTNTPDQARALEVELTA